MEQSTEREPRTFRENCWIIIECIYPTHQPAYDEDKLYGFKTRLLDVLDKYVSRVDLGLEVK